MRQEGPAALSRWEVQVLETVKAKSLQEKAIARRARLDSQIVAELITELMFKGYIERRSRRWLLFFSREYFMITFEGLAALEDARSGLDRIVEILKKKGEEVANEILDGMPPLAADTIKATYRAAKFILR